MLNRFSFALFIGSAVLAGCGRTPPDPSASSTPAATAAAQVQVAAETAGSAQDNGNDVAFWIHPSDPKRSLVLVSAGTAGLEAFALDGTRAAHFTGGEFDYVDVSYGSGTGADAGAIVVAYDRKQRGLWALTIDPQSPVISAVSKKAFQTGGEVVSPDGLMKASIDLAQDLIQLAPQALGMAKHIINMCQNVDTETGRQLERLGQSVLIRTADNKEGMASFSEKRKPKFSGN